MIQSDLHNLTHQQKRILYLEKLYSGTSVSNLVFTATLEGVYDVSVLEKAINIIILNNDGIRLRITEIHNKIKQYVYKYCEKKIDFVEFKGLNSDDEYNKWVDKQAKKPFELLDNELFYFAILMKNNRTIILTKFHHIISDMFSHSLMINEILDLYSKINTHSITKKFLESNIKSSYLKYVQMESEYEKSEKFKLNKKFWSKKFEDLDECTGLIFRSKGKSYGIESNRLEFVIRESVSKKIFEFCSSCGKSPYRVVLAALFLYLSKITLKNDIVVGTLLHNRFDKKLTKFMGMMVNTVPLRIKLNCNQSFMELLKSISNEQHLIVENERYPYDLIIQDLRKNRHVVQGIFDVLVSYQKINYNNQVRAVDWIFNGVETDSLMITVCEIDYSTKLKIQFDYQNNKLSKQDVHRIYEGILDVILQGIENCEKKISQFSIISEKEKNTILNEFNTKKITYENEKVIHKLFEAQVKKSPQNIAISYRNNNITYEQLNIRANQLAYKIRKLGVSNNKIVGIMVERSIEMLIGIIAILKAGGAYLPIDPSYPKERIIYMLEDSKTKILLTNRLLIRNLNLETKDLLCIDIYDKLVYSGKSYNIENINKVGDLAYIIYTSGSTGKPKGVLIEHRNVYNFFNGICDVICFVENKVILAVTTISFDIFVLETLLPLCRGLRIVLTDEEQQNNPQKILQLIDDYNIDMIQTTPSRLRLILSDKENVFKLRNVSEIMVGGEELYSNLLHKIKENTNAKIYNMYGPTETTIWSSVKEIKHEEIITIGKPIKNTYMYIVDNNNNLQPIGIWGELCIGGNGVGRGYINNLDLTQKRFLKNIYGQEGKIYKTGDVARWLPNGEIEFGGRSDNQVKVRGYRIELKEIEEVLINYEGIREVAVIAKEDIRGNKYLSLYFVGNRKYTLNEIREYFLQYLPIYMIPDEYIQLPRLPLTPNGKLDRKALYNLSGNNIGKSEKFKEAETKIEKDILNIWEMVLGKKTIGINDSYFEVGGNSISLIMMQGLLDKIYPNLVSVTDIFSNPTIAKISEFISQKTKKKCKAIELKRISMPIEYFNIVHNGNTYDKIKYKFKGTSNNILKTVASKFNIHISGILLSVFLYLLHEVSCENDITIYTINSNKNNIIPVSINFSKINDVNTLFTIIARKIDKLNNFNPICFINDLKVVTSKKYSIVSLFAINMSLSNELINKFDLVFNINEEDLFVETSFEYNERIKKNKIEGLITNYIEIIKSIIGGKI